MGRLKIIKRLQKNLLKIEDIEEIGQTDITKTFI
jgi:hypothetical protein